MKKNVSNPRPFVIAGYTVIFLTVGVMGGWAATAKLEQAVNAPGLIEVAGSRKDIQHLEGGTIEKIFVEENDFVKKGDPLVKISDVQAKTNVDVLTIRLHIARAVEARLTAERDLADSFVVPESLSEDQNPEVKRAIADQQEIFKDRHSILQSQIDILNSRISQQENEKQGLADQRDAYEKREVILSEKVTRMKDGLESGVIQKNLYSSYQEQLLDVQGNIAKLKTEEAKVADSIQETRYQILQVRQQYKEKASSEYKDANGQVQEYTSQIGLYRDVLQRTLVTAPVDGIVQDLRFHTVGGVVRPGEKLMEVVPSADELVINAHVSPMDVDNVHKDLKAEVKFPSFPSRFVPIVLGEVDSVSTGAITPTDGKTAPYFLTRIKVKKDMLPTEIATRLRPGMTADIVITNGERTVLKYLTSPLTDAIRKSMHEE